MRRGKERESKRASARSFTSVPFYLCTSVCWKRFTLPHNLHSPTKAITIIIIEQNLNMYPINSNNIIFSNCNSHRESWTWNVKRQPQQQQQRTERDKQSQNHITCDLFCMYKFVCVCVCFFQLSFPLVRTPSGDNYTDNLVVRVCILCFIDFIHLFSCPPCDPMYVSDCVCVPAVLVLFIVHNMGQSNG